MNASPLGLFLTWTVYGTHLPGHQTGWRHRNDGPRLPCTNLATWHNSRLNHERTMLEPAMQSTVADAMKEICEFRGWTLWTSSVRSNHVHVVLSAQTHAPRIVRDQLKAKSTRELRLKHSNWRYRPVWSRNGDIQFLDTDHAIEECCIYVGEAQDRKGRNTFQCQPISPTPNSQRHRQRKA